MLAGVVMAIKGDMGRRPTLFRIGLTLLGSGFVLAMALGVETNVN